MAELRGQSSETGKALLRVWGLLLTRDDPLYQSYIFPGFATATIQVSLCCQALDQVILTKAAV